MRCDRCKTGTLKECKAVDKHDGTHYHNHKNQLLTVDTLNAAEIMVYCTNCNHVQIIKENAFFSPKGKPVSKCKHISYSLV